MSLAKFRKTYGKTNSGRFVVSEGAAPSAYLLAHPGLPTWYMDTEDDRFETVMPKGTILSVVVDSNGDSRVVPANGSGSAFIWGDAQTTASGYYSTTLQETGATPASNSGSNTDTVTVGARSVPIGCAQFDVLRPFDKGTSQAASWITEGYVEWPIVDGVNADLAVGGLVRSDHMGRPVACATTDLVSGGDIFSYLVVGKVIEIEKFATNFDDGLLSYMQLPSDPGALKDVYAILRSGPYQGKLGIRNNLDVANAIGAVRVSLCLC
jgi:hypothetical protein